MPALTKLGEKYGVKKLESACNEVFSYTQAPSIRLISTILKSSTGASGSEQSGLKQSGKGRFTKTHDGANAHDANNSNAYGITRGAAYYSNLRKVRKTIDSTYGSIYAKNEQHWCKRTSAVHFSVVEFFFHKKSAAYE